LVIEQLFNNHSSPEE